MNKSELQVAGETELVEELSALTTQTARMRARMSDIMAELERRRRPAEHVTAGRRMSSATADSW